MRMLGCTSLLAVLFLLSACDGGVGSTSSTPTASTNSAAGADLSAVKAYLLEKAAALKESAHELEEVTHEYYGLAKDANFDYAKMWGEKPAEVKQALEKARAAWIEASPLYEQIEGVVAGVPSLAEYDVILDAGASGADGGDNVVPFDLTLPDGKVLPKPGNLFGVTESALWGTYPEFTAPNLHADFNSDSKQDFGESLPDANVLEGAVDELDRVVGELYEAAQAWQPTESDAFTALVVMVPTMSEYFNSWKSSRFVAGDASEQRDFVAISRLSDILGILSGLQVVYGEVSPMVGAKDPAQDKQISSGLEGLKSFVADVHNQETGGKRYTPEEADLLGAEAQNQATAITGQLTQAAAQLNISIQE